MRAHRTLRKEVALEGVGIHTGQRARIVCRPAPAKTGIVLTRTDLAGQPRWALTGGNSGDSVHGGAGRRTLLYGEGGSVETVEHFLAALWSLGLANLLIELEGPELPILDGSALNYIEAFRAAGIEEQSGNYDTFEVREPIFVSGEKSAILALPHDGLKVTYTLDYPCDGLRAQTVSLDLTPESFAEAVAPARTFCAREEADRLRELGFGKGATTENTLVMTADGPVDNHLRFKDECARHKILDLIGDLSFLGADVRAHLIAIRSGHALNHRLREAFLTVMKER